MSDERLCWKDSDFKFNGDAFCQAMIIKKPVFFFREIWKEFTPNVGFVLFL